jgi:hypothetical protein
MMEWAADGLIVVEGYGDILGMFSRAILEHNGNNAKAPARDGDPRRIPSSGANCALLHNDDSA